MHLSSLLKTDAKLHGKACEISFYVQEIEILISENLHGTMICLMFSVTMASTWNAYAATELFSTASYVQATCKQVHPIGMLTEHADLLVACMLALTDFVGVCSILCEACNSIIKFYMYLSQFFLYKLKSVAILLAQQLINSFVSCHTGQ